MSMASSRESWPRKSAGSWKAISAALALGALALGGVAPGAWGQQTTPPAAPTAPAPAANPASPGENSPSTKIPVIRATVELVNVPLTAKTKRGQRVIDLSMDELKVFEDGVEQKITHFERETRTPLRIGVILDTSNSARRQLSYEKDAAQQFVDAVMRLGGSRNLAFLETFDASSSIVQDFTDDPDLLSGRVAGSAAPFGVRTPHPVLPPASDLLRCAPAVRPSA